MAHAVAFFPWAHIDEPKAFGPLKLLPYKKGELPGNLSHITQADIDGVLGAYADRTNHPVRKGTILEHSAWQAGMDMTAEMITKVFRTQNMVAFAALSNRSLFQQHSGYCNYDTYKLVVQRFQPGEAGTFAFSTRRRDGGTRHLWGSDEFAFHRPIHVDANSRMSLDAPLLTALLSLPSTHDANYESIVEFNSANTDSMDVPEHVEVVMCKSAFEWLLGINDHAKSLVGALEKRLTGLDLFPCDGPLKATWLKRWTNLTRPLHAWANDFCAVRGGAAHGKSRIHFVWQAHQHLAFVALFFPLLLKKVLADDGLLTMDSYDLERLRRIEQYLTNDPFDYDWKATEATHPWEAIDRQAFIAARAKLFYPD